MELYILRHGIAEDRSASGMDPDRKLTPEGRKKLRELLKVAARAGVRPTLILTSPYVRAVETAQVAAEELGYGGELVRADSLKPEGAPQAVWDEMRTHRDEAQLLLASHNPLCGEMAKHLLACPDLWVDFKKGALLRIDFEQFGVKPHGLLKWMLTPKLAE